MTKTSLREILQDKKDFYDAESKKYLSVVEEWRQSVRKLSDELRGWLKNSDPSDILQIEEKSISITEMNLGKYDVPRMDIRAFNVWVGIIPKARWDVRNARPPQFSAAEGVTGRVDITNEIRRYVLYRISDDVGNHWTIMDSDDEIRPLTQPLFEEAIASYFQ